MTFPMTFETSNNDSAKPLGHHLLVDLYGVRADLLADAELLQRVLLDALAEAGFQVLKYVTHKFPGEQAGVTALALLCESHAAIHTYPEYEYLALDVFSCGSSDPQVVLNKLEAELRPERVESRCATRGPELMHE